MGSSYIVTAVGAILPRSSTIFTLMPLLEGTLTGGLGSPLDLRLDNRAECVLPIILDTKQQFECLFVCGLRGGI